MCIRDRAHLRPLYTVALPVIEVMQVIKGQQPISAGLCRSTQHLSLSLLGFIYSDCLCILTLGTHHLVPLLIDVVTVFAAIISIARHLCLLSLLTLLPCTPISICLLDILLICLLYTSPSPRDRTRSRMPSSA
eukprot:TRINITY_DN24642_c0_g1_i1.p1 TRINITY_DN24642_c0_g1~~TRINITY_DN24642_c0_g1_i1.p1  ORF type:complete len:133 (-),score=60.38 TRINITY_DN24642_c0_g1_i1:49-447(-)